MLEDENLLCLCSNDEPLSFKEVVKDEKRIQAMKEEIQAIEKNNTWELASLPCRHQAIGVKWVNKTKKNSKGDVERYKARLVVKGYKQKQ